MDYRLFVSRSRYGVMSGRWHAKFWGRSVPAIGRTRIFGGLNSFDSFVQQTTVCWTLFEFFHSNHQYRTFYLYRVTDRMPAAAGRNQCACNPWLLNLTLRRNDQLRRHCRLLSIKTAISTPYLTVSRSRLKSIQLACSLIHIARLLYF